MQEDGIVRMDVIALHQYGLKLVGVPQHETEYSPLDASISLLDRGEIIQSLIRYSIDWATTTNDRRGRSDQS